MAGVSAGLLAQAGFTGAPALTVEGPEVAEFWSDLGQKWLIVDQYFKPHAVCRWAQPAMTGALSLYQTHNLSPESIRRIRVFSFHEATRLACRHPQTTEEAQYSLPFPVAATLVHGQLGPAQLSGEALTDPVILALADRVELIEDEAYNAHFPALRLSRVEIETTDGQWFDSGEVQANWDITSPPTDTELHKKFRWLAQTNLLASRATAIKKTVWQYANLSDAQELITLLTPPPQIG